LTGPYCGPKVNLSLQGIVMALRILAGSSALVLLTQGAGLADVTPAQVWQNIQTATQAESRASTTTGATLRLQGVTLGGADLLVRLGDIRLTDKGDGTVDVQVPEKFDVTLHSPGGQDTVISLAAPGARLTASGTPDAISYALDAPKLDAGTNLIDTRLDVTVTDLSARHQFQRNGQATDLTDDLTLGALTVRSGQHGLRDRMVARLDAIHLTGQVTHVPDAAATMDLQAAMDSGMTAAFGLSFGGGTLGVGGRDAGAPVKATGSLSRGSGQIALGAHSFHADADVTALALAFAGPDQTTGKNMAIATTLADVSSQVDLSGAEWVRDQAFSAALHAGLKVSAEVDLGASTLDFQGAGPTRLTTKLDSAQSGFALDSHRMQASAGVKALAVTATSPDIPLPEVSFSLGEMAFNLGLPTEKSADPAPFSYLTRLVDLQVADPLWALIDPAHALPHDPASLIIDTRGSVVLTRDLATDAAGLQGDADPQAFQLATLDITQLLARAAGAEAQASGAFTFDPTDTTTFDGMPAPTGKIDLRAKGVNKLLDALVKMGLLPSDKAMMARMMLSMFTTPSGKPDQITSTFEVRDKKMYANGQQLQ
jgi:hypothetical protein